MKLNKEKFMKTEMGGELEETIRTWDKAIDERRKATPGIGNPDQGLGFKYWDNTCRSCQDRWVLLHNPQQGIAIPTRDITREYTKAQKEFLYDYYMERDCKEEANAIWQDE